MGLRNYSTVYQAPRFTVPVRLNVPQAIEAPFSFYYTDKLRTEAKKEVVKKLTNPDRFQQNFQCGPTQHCAPPLPSQGTFSGLAPHSCLMATPLLVFSSC